MKTGLKILVWLLAIWIAGNALYSFCGAGAPIDPTHPRKTRVDR